MAVDWNESLDAAWFVIANVSGGDWSEQSEEWQAIAHKWGVLNGYRLSTKPIDEEIISKFKQGEGVAMTPIVEIKETGERFELKPCPFCGAVPTIHDTGYVTCQTRTCGVGRAFMGDVELWNRRAPRFSPEERKALETIAALIRKMLAVANAT